MSSNFNNSGRNISKNFYNSSNAKSTMNFGTSEIDYASLNPHEDLSTNLMSILENEVKKLKKESEDFKKVKESNKQGKVNHGDEIFEDKVMTNYLCTKDDRMQAIKHVTTQNKAEYMSLEELQKMKEENAKKLIEIENEYYKKKVKAEQRAKNIDEFIHRDENKKISLEEINDILRNEEDYFQKDFKTGKSKNKYSKNLEQKSKLEYDENGKIIKKKFQRRPKSTKNIRRFAVNELDKPLSKNEEKYVKKYVNYVMKKNRFNNEPNEDSENDKEDWNKTKILSQNVRGGINRNDGLTGHLYNDDYSFYYLSINSENTPKSLSLKSFKTPKNSSSKNKKLLRKSNEKHLRKNYNLYTESSASHCNYNFNSNNNISKNLKQRMNTENSRISNKQHHNSKLYNPNEDHLDKSRYSYNNVNTSDLQKKKKSRMNSHLAFGKLIFQLMDKNKTGKIAKDDLLRELELDEYILFDLGFESQEHLIEKLQEYKTVEEEFLDEQEFIAFLLSRSEMNEEYLENYRNNYHDGNMQEENNYDFNAGADMEDMDNKYYQGEEIQYFEGIKNSIQNLFYFIITQLFE